MKKNMNEIIQRDQNLDKNREKFYRNEIYSEKKRLQVLIVTKYTSAVKNCSLFIDSAEESAIC